MYYYCAKLNAFKLPQASERTPGGGIIAASAVPYPMLVRRSFTLNPYLEHRCLDPQLYLATLDPRVSSGPVYKLATYPWFGTNPPAYDSGDHGTLNDYKTAFMDSLCSNWTRTVPMDDGDILDCAKSALSVQVEVGCEALIAPSPLSVSNVDYQLETRYLDGAIEAAASLRTSLPVYATVAISDTLLRNVEPANNALIRTIADNIAARSELAGAYIVLEQSADTGYNIVNEETLLSLLILVDDLVRGARKQVMINYVGSFGAVARAAGAKIWASGYYRSQRRMRLADQEEDVGRAYPRFFSASSAGDIGLQSDLPGMFGTKLYSQVFTRTGPSTPLDKAIRKMLYPAAAPEWEYRPSNISAAAAHYNDVCCKLEAGMDHFDDSQRIDAVSRWLGGAAAIANEMVNIGVSATHTDIRHQEVWLSAFTKWRDFVGR